MEAATCSQSLKKPNSNQLTLPLDATVFEEDRRSGRIIGIVEVAQADADQTVELLRAEMYTLPQGQCNFGQLFAGGRR